MVSRSISLGIGFTLALVETFKLTTFPSLDLTRLQLE